MSIPVPIQFIRIQISYSISPVHQTFSHLTRRVPPGVRAGGTTYLYGELSLCKWFYVSSRGSSGPYRTLGSLLLPEFRPYYSTSTSVVQVPSFSWNPGPGSYGQTPCVTRRGYLFPRIRKFLLNSSSRKLSRSFFCCVLLCFVVFLHLGVSSILSWSSLHPFRSFSPEFPAPS